MYSRWSEEPTAPDFIPSTETVVSSIAEDETIDIDIQSLEPSEFALASRPPSDILSRSGADKQDASSVAKEDLEKTFDLSINGDEEEGGCCRITHEDSSSSDEDNVKFPAKLHQNSPNTQATYASEPTPQKMFALDITEVLQDEEARADNEYLESTYKDYRYCPFRLGGPRTPQIVLMVLALVAAALGVVGSVLPNVPSMPFVLLSAVFSFAFCLGSVTYLGRPVD